MNCHNNNQNDQGHAHKKHMWLMVLCCALPVILIGVFAWFKIGNPATRSLLTGAALFLCPLLHLLMLPMLFGWGKKRREENQTQYQPIPIEVKKLE